MELFQIVFWIVTLYSSLQAYPACKRQDLKTEEIKTVTCESESIFYTPENVEAKCITAALDCVKRELHTALMECKDDYEYISQGIAELDNMIENRPDKDHALTSNDCPCEKWPERNFTMFLGSLNSLCELYSSSSS